MELKDVISFNGDFQASVNIGYDLGLDQRIKALIPTAGVLRYLEEILKDVAYPSNVRAKLLVGAYGKGKSHIALAALTAMWTKDPALFSAITAAYKASGHPFAEAFEVFVESGPRLLPVIISGSSSDLRRSLLYALRSALRNASLDELMPNTNYEGALAVLRRWNEQYPSTMATLTEATGRSFTDFESALLDYDTSAYQDFVDTYPSLTSGSSFDALDGADVIAVYEEVAKKLKLRGVSGIYVVYDEFSKYLESSMAAAGLEEVKLLQDFAEKCCRSNMDMQLHLLLISHKSLSNYIDAKLPKERVDGWRGVSGRFREVEMAEDAEQAYELMSKAIVKDQALLELWMEEGNHTEEVCAARAAFEGQGRLFSSERQIELCRNCFPLHPLTTFLLPRLSEKVAQNERTLFTFLCSEENLALSNIVSKFDGLISPDAIYDYFEPLLKKEPHENPTYKAYELARFSLVHLDADSLSAKIVKTVAVIDAVGQYESVFPTKALVTDVYRSCGFDIEEIAAALRLLIEEESILYLRISDSKLSLKKSSGVNIDQEIANRAEGLRNRYSVPYMLDSFCAGRAIYPSRYNEIHDMVRYFDCAFIPASEVSADWEIVAGSMDDEASSGDGFVMAVVISSVDELAAVEVAAQAITAKHGAIVFSLPKSYVDIEDSLYRCAASRELKEEAADDEVLYEEYDIAYRDLSEVIGSYIAGYFHPERGFAKFVIDGKVRSDIRRRAKLSDELSKLCERAYPNAPRIRSEALNKNKLTGTAMHSRARLLNALCSTVLEPNLGFVGNGQEVSMARSALRMTGIISDLECPEVDLHPANEQINKVLTTIEKFLLTSSSTKFNKLYRDLTGLGLGIGMRKGPIPVFLAVELRAHRNEVVISHKGEERTFSAALIDDIDAQPEDYTVTAVDWSENKAQYVAALSDLFGCPGASRGRLVDTMRRWLVGLPQVTRLANLDQTGLATSDQFKVHLTFMKHLGNINTGSSKLLFEEIPASFGLNVEDEQLIAAIREEKSFCDGYAKKCKEKIAREIKALFVPVFHEDACLKSVLDDWYEGLSQETKSHVFTGAAAGVLAAIDSATPDDCWTTDRFAKSITSLRVDDWNSQRFGEFFDLLALAKDEIEAYGSEDSILNACGSTRISYISEDGAVIERSFEPVECSRRGEMLRRDILSCLDEVGRSLPQEERRQIVFEILRGLC